MQLYNLKRNFIVWSIVVIICSIPSFLLAFEHHDNLAMYLGIILIIIAYALASSTSFYQNIKQNNPLFAKALKVSFGIKIVLAILMIIGFATGENKGIFFYPIIPDMYAGLAATSLVELFFTSSTKVLREFIPTLSIVLVEAFIMSLALLILALIIYPFLLMGEYISKKEEEL